MQVQTLASGQQDPQNGGNRLGDWLAGTLRSNQAVSSLLSLLLSPPLCLCYSQRPMHETNTDCLTPRHRIKSLRPVSESSAQADLYSQRMTSRTGSTGGGGCSPCSPSLCGRLCARKSSLASALPPAACRATPWDGAVFVLFLIMRPQRSLSPMMSLHPFRVVLNFTHRDSRCCFCRMWSFEQPHGAINIVVNLRMTVVRLEGGGLWVHSPIAPTRECIRLLRELESR